MKKTCLLTIFLFSTLGTYAQFGSLEDSLLRSIQAARTDTAKAILLYELGDQWSVSDTGRAAAYIREGLRRSGKFPFYQGVGFFYLGRAYMDTDGNKAIIAFDKALDYLHKYQTPESYRLQSRTWANKAVIAQRNNDNKQYLDIFLNHAIPLAAKARDSIRVAEGYTNIALPFMNYEEYDKAIFYFHKSIEIFRRHAPLDPRQADNFTNLANIYIHRQMLPEAKTSLDSAFAILEKDPHSLYFPYYYTTEGMYYRAKEDWKKAENSLEKGLVIAEKIKSRFDIRSLLFQKAKLYNSKHDLLASRNVLLKIYNEGYAEIDSDKRNILQELAFVEAELGNMGAAYRWQTMYSELSDSFYKKQSSLQIADLEGRYNYVQKEKELLKANNKERKQRMIMWGSIGGMLLTGGLFYYLFRLRKDKAEQELVYVKQQQQIAVAQALLEGEEKERTRLARDLHDGLGGMLAGVKINLTSALQDTPSAEMNRVISQLDNSVTELRRIARNMMPEALLRSGLESALAELCQSCHTDRLHVYSSFLNIKAGMPKQIEIIIYRIVQELLANVVRHAEATEAFVQCSQDGNTFYITTEDNGKGFDQASGKSSKGLGLGNIRSRVEFLKGKLDIYTKAGKGTIVNIELPTDERA